MMTFSFSKIRFLLISLLLALGFSSLLVLSRTPNPIVPLPSDTQNIAEVPVTFVVGGQQIAFQVPDGISVKECMERLQSQGKVTFAGKEANGLGFYVDEINGIKSDSKTGKYWSFYQNGALSQVGVSEARVHANDKIEWKYESF